MSKPKILGASVPRKKSFVISGDTGEYDAINKGEQKADVVDGVRMVEDSMERKEGGEKVKTASGRYQPPRKTRAISTEEPENRRSRGMHYDPFYNEKVVDLFKAMLAYIEDTERG